MHRWRAGIAASALALPLSHAVLAGEAGTPGDGADFLNPALAGREAECSFCLPHPPDELFQPMRFDWSLGLRGGIRHKGDGDPVYEVIAEPEIRLEQNTIRGGYDFGLSGDIVYRPDGEARLGSATASAGGRYDLDELTTLEGRARLTASQDDADADDQPANVSAAPLELTGELEGSAARDLGPVVVELRGSAGRHVVGETSYTDGTTSSNDYQDHTSWGAGTRAGLKLAPGVLAFVDAAAEVERYDIESPTLLRRLDNVTYEARVGLTARPSAVLELEGSIGLGHRDFGDEGLPDFSAMLYGGKAVFRPDETLTLSGELETRIGSPGAASGATARLEHVATAAAAYVVNPWVRLRASAQWSTARYEGIGTTEKKWGGGAGADYLLNTWTDVTADYRFERSETAPAPAVDTHQVTVGVKFHR